MARQQPRATQPGQIIWLDDCPPLDDDRSKRRPVVVMEVPKPAEAHAASIVICCSTTAGGREFDAVRLPDRSTQPQCRTGLTKPTHAIPRWFLPVDSNRLADGELSGRLTGNAWRDLQQAYLLRRDGWVIAADALVILLVSYAQLRGKDPDDLSQADAMSFEERLEPGVRRICVDHSAMGGASAEFMRGLRKLAADSDVPIKVTTMHRRSHAQT